MDFGDDFPEGSDSHGQQQNNRRKRYHRHTPRQIQTLEGMFKECPHPDENQRAQLSRELGLEARQIKFWFQNRRTQMKAQHERADNCFLRAENDKIRCENIAMGEALKNVICPTCGGPPVGEDFFDEQKLRMENARLKEELDRVSSVASKFLGRPYSMSQMPHGTPPLSVNSLDLSMGSLGMGGQPLGVGGLGGGPTPQDLELLGSSEIPQFQMPAPVSEMERPVMAGIAARAMDEVIRLANAGEHVWIKVPGGDGYETLNVDTYDSLFGKPGSSSSFRAGDVRVEGTRHCAHVFMSAAPLVEVFMDTNKWMEFFPSIVANARTVDNLVNGLDGRSESLILMYEEMHMLTPLVQSREFSFLRYCRQIDQGLWAIADVSVETERDAQFGVPSRSRRLPSGCLIADMANGYSKVTWVEHMEIEDKGPIGVLYRDMVTSGAGFGAQRWLGALSNACDRYGALAALAVMNAADLGAVTADGRRSMMKLSQRMVANFCGALTANQLIVWTTIPGGANDMNVRVSLHRVDEPGLPNGVVLSAATSVWLPVPCDHVFVFLRDVNTRNQWDVLTHGNTVQEACRIPNGSDPANCVTLLRGVNASHDSMLVLQESCADPSGSMLVYSPIDMPAVNLVTSGEDTANIPLLPSGFIILPDGRNSVSAGGGAGSSGGGVLAGCVVTVAFQILISSLPACKVNSESIATVGGLINTTIANLKTALNCG